MITQESLTRMRGKISDSDISEKRKRHILSVEDMAIRIGEIYAPEKLDILRAAALLHDITKEYPLEQQIEICRAHGHVPSEVELYAPKTFHARTAAMLIPERYPEFDSPEIISAVRWHTTGRSGMTLTEKIIYLADYIDDTRKFDDCIKLRNAFFDAEPQKMNEAERLRHLDDIMIMSYNMTIFALLDEGKPISPDTTDSLNELLCRRIKEMKGIDNV